MINNIKKYVAISIILMNLLFLAGCTVDTSDEKQNNEVLNTDETVITTSSLKNEENNTTTENSTSQSEISESNTVSEVTETINNQQSENAMESKDAKINDLNKKNISIATGNNEITILENFITKYNELESISISNCVDFIASDKTSGYYRTEFRLLAFKNAKSKHGKIGDSDIDMIDYSSELGTIKYKQFRVYISSKDFNNAKKIATSSIKILDSSISDDDIQNILNSTSSSFVLGKYITGTFTKSEIMIDFTKNN